VADGQADGDGAVRDDPSQSVRGLGAFIPHKASVAARISGPRPRPAGIRPTAPVDVVVKPLGKRPSLADVGSFNDTGSHLLLHESSGWSGAGSVFAHVSRPRFFSMVT
jgi:hypothetical protein